MQDEHTQYGVKWLEVTSMNVVPKIDCARHIMVLNLARCDKEYLGYDVHATESWR